MMRFFNGLKQKINSGHTLKLIIDLSHNEKDKPRALKMCAELVEQHPFNVQIRHILACLQQDMGLEIDLPDIASKGFVKK